MDKNEAKELLSFHSTRNEDIDNMKWEKGFLGSLRPFRSLRGGVTSCIPKGIAKSLKLQHTYRLSFALHRTMI